MNKFIKYNLLLSVLLILVFISLSFQASAGDVKIIIDSSGPHRQLQHRNSRYKHPHHFYNRYYYENRLGVRDRQGNKFINRSYGNVRYGYGDYNGYSTSIRYRNNRSYCPY